MIITETTLEQTPYPIIPPGGLKVREPILKGKSKRSFVIEIKVDAYCAKNLDNIYGRTFFTTVLIDDELDNSQINNIIIEIQKYVVKRAKEWLESNCPDT